MDINFRFIKEFISVDGVSTNRASPNIGMGGTKLAQNNM